MVEITRKKPFIFNPGEETKEMLIATFVIRTTVFEKVFAEIKKADPTTPPQHCLLVGQRGMGKTTLLLRLQYAIKDDAELAAKVLPVRFSEEQYNISNLAELWEETAQYLDGLNPVFGSLCSDMLLQEREQEYERIAFDLLAKSLKTNNKRIVLLIDNVDELFKKLEANNESHRFREILMTSPYLQLIGASARVLEHQFDYGAPFFEFFYQLKLEPLNHEDAIKLMQALTEHFDVNKKVAGILEHQPARIEALRRITGGVPRTLVLLFEILVDTDNGAAFEDLEELADRVTSLYKERMDSLKPQQQKIMDALAHAWEAIGADEILKRTKLYREGAATNQISAQLKQLEDNQLIETIPIGKRKRLYRIRERFFNIWYLMRHGKKNVKEQVFWLTRFFEAWCTAEDLEKITGTLSEKLEQQEYFPRAAYLKAAALYNVAAMEENRKNNLLLTTKKFLNESGKTEWANNLEKLYNHNSQEINKSVVSEPEPDFIYNSPEPALHTHPHASTASYTEIAELMKVYEKAITNVSFIENNLTELVQLTLGLLHNQQTHFLLRQFQKEGSLAMKYLQPVYYAIAYLLRDEMPGEYEKAGAEMKETVDEIIAEVLRKDESRDNATATLPAAATL